MSSDVHTIRISSLARPWLLLALVISSFVTGVNCPAQVPLAGQGKARAAIVIGARAGEFTRLAATELQSYLRKITGAEFEQVNETDLDKRPATESILVLGSAEQNGLVRAAADAGLCEPAGLKGEGFVLKALNWKQHPAVVIAGADDAGTLYGAYELLERLGITFRITGDILPPSNPGLAVPELSLRKEPAFKRRGFLHSAAYDNVTMYDWPEYEQMLDQMARMKCNYLQFWWFEFTPWVKFSYRGEDKLLGDVSGKESGYQTWARGAFGSRTVDEVVIGRERFRGRSRMAPLGMQHIETPEEAFDYSKNLLQRLIAHAAQRNIKVWLVVEMASLPPNLARHGELVGDQPFNYLQGAFMHPQDPVNREIQLNRLKALAETYPQAEGVFLNFSELYPELATEKHREFFEQRRPEFLELRSRYLPWSGVLANFYNVSADRIVDSNIGYFDLFNWLLKKRDETLPNLKLGLMTVGRGYALPLFDKKLPVEVPFASLESSGIWTPTGVPMDCFGGMGKRERILQPRIDDDFEMVGMQLSVRQFVERDRVFEDSLKYGVSGIAGQVERPRGTEFNSSFLAAASWEPGLTPEQFYLRQAERMFGRKAGSEVAAALLKLEDNQQYLGYYEYDGGYGVLLCCSAVREVNAAYNYYLQPNPFAGPTASSWKHLIAETPEFIAKRENSIRLMNEALGHFKAAAEKVTPESRHEFDYLVNRTESYRDLFAGLNTYRKGMMVFDAAFRHRSQLEEKEFLAQLESGLASMHQGYDQLEAATKKFNEIVDHVSDLGVLYQLNTRLILGTQLSLQFLENVVNYHRGKPYLGKVNFDRIFYR